MSGQRMTVTLDHATSGVGSIPPAFKNLMEILPPRLCEGEDDSEKEKLCLDGNLDQGGSGTGPSAALTPAIWDKTIPYDGENFHLEYMDLEDFLMENGIADIGEGSSQKRPLKEQATGALVSLLPTVDLDLSEEEVVANTTSQLEVASEICEEETADQAVGTEDIEVNINFEVDPTDLLLSSVPGGEVFNPRKHKFLKDELKPQPMIKKAKKMMVPEEKKDEKYWQRRNKNNVAAKRSRDARRLKENQITVRAAFLEQENMALRSEVAELRKECGCFKAVVTSYQAKYGPL